VYKVALPERREGARSRKFFFPSPKGRGARGEGLRNFYITSVIVMKHENQ
jgi:hypothetical protein